MSAGYIQLAALGQQDVYLTGEPQVSYFAGVYRRHTPFVLEAFDIPFLEQNVNFGSQAICRIPPKGDLIRGMTLKMTLPQLAPAAAQIEWYWPQSPSPLVRPIISFNTISNIQNISIDTTWYSTYQISSSGSWLNPLAANISYSPGANKFIYSGVSNVWVQSVLNGSLLSSGIFWSLDPNSADFVYSNTSSPTTNTWYGYNVSGSLSSTFTLEQSGWIQNPYQGTLPPANPNAGMYLKSNSTGALTTSGSFLLLNNFTYYDVSSRFSVTNYGRISVSENSWYIMKLGFSGGTVSRVGWGQDNGSGPPNYINFSGNQIFPVSPNPSTPIIFPVNITDFTNNSIYIYAYGTFTSAYVTLNKLNDAFIFNSNYVLSLIDQTLVFSSTVLNSLKLNSSYWNFTTTGTYLVSGQILLSSGYVSNVTVWEGSNLVYNYDMSSQGINPTFSFTIPITVTDIVRSYHINVASTVLTSILPGTVFMFNKVGTSSNPLGVLPLSGLTFSYQGPSNIITNPLQIVSSDFNSNGYVYTGGSDGGTANLSGTSNIIFNTIGTYILTGRICTSPQLTSLSINSGTSTTTYNLAVGSAPAYNLNIPFRVLDTNANTSISITTNGIGNIYSNTFFSIYPFANTATATSVKTYTYYDSPGTLAVTSAELRIGGQLIQTLTGEAIEIYNDLMISYENQPALTVLNGKLDTSNNYAPRTYYVNLPFYFYDHPELSLPIAALDRQDVEVWVSFNNFTNLTAISVSNPQLYATIITEYVYLSDPEINWFKKNRIDQVIVQNQYQTFDLAAGFNSGVFELLFFNPVRSLFFVVQDNASQPWKYLTIQSIGLTFNGYDAFTAGTTDSTYLNVIEPLKNYPNFPVRNFSTYTFCKNATAADPSGFVNFSRIRHVLMTLATLPLTGPSQLRVMALNHNVLRFENGIAGLMFNSHN